ncbi:MAG TPA: hypothetical protein PKH24_10200 [Sedimentisphaerales bacterium]|nr:hypothetical protein [Sedimentisphaerales bacterium]HNU29499.1 hypothetical protein [Sedimentisphaerales bacterium]
MRMTEMDASAGEIEEPTELGQEEEKTPRVSFFRVTAEHETNA